MYKLLPKTVTVTGTGIKGLTAELIDRTENVCLYKRIDDVYETFIVNRREKTEIFGKEYPPMEVYPSNEDFGQTAWCIRDKERAYKKFKTLSNGNKPETN